MACGVDDLILLASIAATTAGAGASYAGQQKAQRAMNSATNVELARQKEIQDRANAEFAQSLTQSAKPVAEKQIQEGETQREQGYQQAQAVPLNVGNQQLVGGQNAALNLQDSAQRALSNRARAKLGSYDKWQLDQAIKNLRSSQQQQLFNQEAQRSQAILPLELQDASHKGDSLQGVGMGLGALGSLLSLGSLAGIGAGTNAASSGGLAASAWSPAQQAAFVSTPLATASNTAPAFGTASLFPSLARTAGGMSGLYGLTGRY